MAKKNTGDCDPTCIKSIPSLLIHCAVYFYLLSGVENCASASFFFHVSAIFALNALDCRMKPPLSPHGKDDGHPLASMELMDVIADCGTYPE